MGNKFFTENDEKKEKQRIKKVINRKIPPLYLKTTHNPSNSPPNQKIQKYSGSTQTFQNEKMLIKHKDRRKKVQNPSKFPHSPKGVIETTFTKGTYLASGVMIYPMIVLTAAHNVYNRHTKEYAKKLKFIPGKNNDSAKFGVYNVLDFFFPDEYKENEIEDYAILVIDRGEREFCPGIYTGYFGLKIVKSFEDVKGDEVSVHGYPGDKCFGSKHEMWGMEIRVGEGNFEIGNGVARYEIDTFCGQSGSGLVLKSENDYYVFGVHVRGRKEHNEATLITEKRLRNIKQWIVKGLLKFKHKFKNEIKKYLIMEIRDGVLDLCNNNIREEGIKYLSEIKLNNLEKIFLSGNKINNQGIKYLAKMKLDNLKELYLSNNNIQVDGIKFLSEMELENLEVLDLRKNNLGNEGLKYLSIIDLESLEKLFLGFNDIGDNGIKFLSCMKFDNLEELFLDGNKISDYGMKYLCEMKLENLEKLYLSDNKIGDEGMKYFCDIKLDNLEELYLSNNNIGDKGKKYLSQIKMDNLEILNLNGNKIGDETIKFFSEMKLENLEKLYLNSNKIGDKGIKYLSEIPLYNLEVLDLRNNNIGDEGIKYLSEMELDNLKELNLHENVIGIEGQKYLSTLKNILTLKFIFKIYE